MSWESEEAKSVLMRVSTVSEEKWELEEDEVSNWYFNFLAEKSEFLGEK